MNKKLIAKRFEKNLKTYNENAKIQKQMAEKLVQFLDKEEYDNILEIGCGTGMLTEIIKQKIEYKNYTANDIVSKCEDYIKSIDKNIHFSAGDIEECVKVSEKKYDLIISNASFQWIDNLKEFIEILYKKLNPQGCLIFSTFGIENFREIYHVQGKRLPYYTTSELREILQSYNPVIEEEIRILAFRNPKDVLKHIQNTGVNALSEESWTKTDLINFENGYNNFCSGQTTLTYNPIYIKFLK